MIVCPYCIAFRGDNNAVIELCKTLDPTLRDVPPPCEQHAGLTAEKRVEVLRGMLDDHEYIRRKVMD